MSGESTMIDDKYQVHEQVDLQKLRDEALEDGEEQNDGFLKIYKENKDQVVEDEDQGVKEIKYKREEE